MVINKTGQSELFFEEYLDPASQKTGESRAEEASRTKLWRPRLRVVEVILRRH
jgi:hypothetical protein